MPRPRVVLADDHALLLDAFEKLLAPEFEIVAKVADGEALLAVVQQLRPDVVVLDVAMPGVTGLDAPRRIRGMQPQVGLVFLTMFEEPNVAAETLRLGSCAYVLKSSAGSELVTAIWEVLNRHSYVTTLLTGHPVDALQHVAAARHRGGLTSRQREILQLLADGRSMKEVAAVLHITPRTVAFHKYRMMKHLRITNTARLIQFAVKEHLVS